MMGFGSIYPHEEGRVEVGNVPAARVEAGKAIMHSSYVFRLESVHSPPPRTYSFDLYVPPPCVVFPQRWRRAGERGSGARRWGSSRRFEIEVCSRTPSRSTPSWTLLEGTVRPTRSSDERVVAGEM